MLDSSAPRGDQPRTAGQSLEAGTCRGTAGSADALPAGAGPGQRRSSGLSQLCHRRTPWPRARRGVPAVRVSWPPGRHDAKRFARFLSLTPHGHLRCQGWPHRVLRIRKHEMRAVPLWGLSPQALTLEGSALLC